MAIAIMLNVVQLIYVILCFYLGDLSFTRNGGGVQFVNLGPAYLGRRASDMPSIAHTYGHQIISHSQLVACPTYLPTSQHRPTWLLPLSGDVPFVNLLPRDLPTYVVGERVIPCMIYCMTASISQFVNLEPAYLVLGSRR